MGSEFSGLEFGVWGLGFGVWGLGFGVSGFGTWVWGLGFRVSGFRFRVSGLGFGVSGFGSRVWGLGSGIWGIGCIGEAVAFGAPDLKHESIFTTHRTTQFQNNCFTEMCSGSEEGSYARRMDVCIAHL